MAQKVIKIGKSTGVTIPKDILEEMKLKAGDQITVEYDKKESSLVVRPEKKITDRQQKIAVLTQNFIERYRADLEKLANE